MWQYSTSSEMTSVCDPTQAIHQAELLSRGKHPKVNVPQWRADPWPDLGQWPVIILVLSVRASSEPAAAKRTIPEAVQSG